MLITTSELCGFGIGFGIGRKYRPITVSVSVSGRNQNGGFGRSLLLRQGRRKLPKAGWASSAVGAQSIPPLVEIGYTDLPKPR